MKRSLLMLLCVIMTALLSCKPAFAALSVLACEPEWAALAKEIGGDKINVSSATNGTQDVHHITARPSLLASMRHTDLLVCSGAGLEAGWLPVLLRQAGGESVQPGGKGNLMLSQYIRLQNVPARIDRSLGDIHPEGNPHLHLDPRNILLAAKVLADRMAQLDPENSHLYGDNLSGFSARWQKLIVNWTQSAASLKGKKVIIHHDGWVYLLNWLGVQNVAMLEVKPGIPPTPSHLQNVLETAKAQNVKTILLAPFDNEEAAEWLSEQTGARIVHLPYTVGGDDETGNLADLFDRTLSLLKEGMQ